ncbi:MAG: DUF4982 domain-containing protein [Ruminococcus sp.]|nr:DUF4982 domain-containing protein [Ruminococcus sp.]
MRETILFCDGWEFSLQPIGSEYRDDLEWQRVDIPHDWLIEDTKDLYKTSTGWYRRVFTVPEDGRRTSLRFEGVYMDCRVYVNGSLAGEWKYGYTTFEFDITDLLVSGENLVTVRVDHREPNSRWYSGAGIYRRVWLNRFGKTHFLPDGVYISADEKGGLTVTSETERPEGDAAAPLSLRTTVYYGGEIKAGPLTSAVCAADRSVLPAEITRSGWSYSSNTQYLKVENPKLWELEKPELYTCVTELLQDGEVIDSVSIRFGFRKIEFTTDKGFFLNSRHVKLHGACMHHDLGALGSAVNRYAVKRQLLKLREMGVNAVRTSHNPPAAELLELADELGFLILDEAFDMWEGAKTTYDYARFFPEWVRRDVASWIRRDRNHPCLIGWSIGNEIYDTNNSERGQEVTSLLKALVQQHDPRRTAYITIGSNYMGGENARRCADILKVAGYNYAERLYDKQHAEHPDWMIYGSETSSVVQSRGIYHFPLERPILCEDDEQCSSLGNSAPAWAAKSWEACIIPDRDRDFCAGQFIWTGFDYIGEPTPYSTKNSYFGHYDTAGFPKDSSYVFRTVWTDGGSRPFVHIFPYWDFTEGDMIDIRVASNCSRVEVYFNDEHIAGGDLDPAHSDKLTLDIKLPYRKGVIRALAYDASGNEVCCDEVRSFGDAAGVTVTADRETLRAGSDELCFAEISAVDENGVFAANANDRVFVSVTGAGRLIGLDNGDPTDYEQYKGTSRRLFSGKLLAVIAPTGEDGEIRLTVTSPSLKKTELILRSEKAEPIKGMSFVQSCSDRPCDCPDAIKDIPVRRIELSGERTVFDAEHTELSFKTRLYPANTVYGGDIEYRITTESGIVSPLAEIVSQTEKGVTVRCFGDGEFFLRAFSRNGTEKIHIFSMLKLRAEGIGSALIDPYSNIPGGLFTAASNAANGMQHGVSIGQGGGWIGYDNLDFGSVGSDEITVSLFANYSTPVRIKVWDGTPEDGTLLGDFEYDLKPIWLTYQEMTFKLPVMLRGVRTISLQSDIQYEVGLFRFRKYAKENSELPALYAENIYGDSFTRSEDAVTDIGNNVTIDFGMFEFKEPPEKICITGRSALAVNSIGIKIEGGECMQWQFEFEGCSEYTERCFPLDGVRGSCRVSVVFLPGCEFDLRSIRFG